MHLTFLQKSIDFHFPMIIPLSFAAIRDEEMSQILCKCNVYGLCLWTRALVALCQPLLMGFAGIGSEYYSCMVIRSYICMYVYALVLVNICAAASIAMFTSLPCSLHLYK